MSGIKSGDGHMRKAEAEGKKERKKERKKGTVATGRDERKYREMFQK